MSSSDLIQVAKPSIKDHPCYAEAATTILLGLGFLGPELTAAVAIVVHGWFSWEKPATSLAETQSHPLPLSTAMNQGCTQHIQAVPIISREASSASTLLPGLEITEQGLNKRDEHTEPLQLHLSTFRAPKAIPIINLPQASLLASAPASPSSRQESLSEALPNFVLEHQLRASMRLRAKRAAFLISWQPQVNQLHRQLSLAQSQKHEAEQISVNADIPVRGLESTILERDETILKQDQKSQELMTRLHSIEQLSNAREAHYKTLETEVGDLRDCLQLLQDREQENEQLRTEVNGLQNCRFMLQNQQREIDESRIEVGRSRQVLQDRNLENQQLKTQVAELKAQLFRSQEISLRPQTLKSEPIVQDLQVLEANNTIFQQLLRDGQNLDGLPAELRNQLYNARGSRLRLEANVGEVQYILVDGHKPQMGYYFPVYNQLLITSGGSSPIIYTALKPGVTMDSVPRDIQARCGYEIELGPMFPRCILRLTEPLVNAHFDYMIRYGPNQSDDAEFPTSWGEYLACQLGTDLNYTYNVPFADFHRKHLGVKATVQIVNKQCFPFTNLENREAASIIDGYTGPQSLVRNGDRASWEFDMIHKVGGEETKLRSVDAAGYLAQLQPWHDEEITWWPENLPVYDLPWEELQRHGFKSLHGRAAVWEASKQIPTESQHRVRDAIDPTHLYSQRMNIVSTNLFDEKEEERDLALANGRSFHASQFSVGAFNNGSNVDCCCEFEQPGYICGSCYMKFHGSWRQLGRRCQKWVEKLPCKCTGLAGNGDRLFKWKGKIAFKNKGTLTEHVAADRDVAEHDVSFMGLEATPEAVAPGEDMPLPVEPWTGEPTTIKGRYIRGGHLMVDSIGIEWIRFFPLTGNYIVSAKIINKIQRFGVPGEVYKENHPGWKEFCVQNEALTCRIEHPEVGAVLHTRTYVDKMIIDHSLPFMMDHSVRYDITRGQAYDEFDMQEIYHLDDSKRSQLLPIFGNGEDNFRDKVGGIETLCPRR